VRRCTDDDVPWAMSLFKRRYPNRYDFETTESWVRNVVLRNPGLSLAVRTANAFLAAILIARPWLPADWECHVVAVYADFGHTWETVPLLKYSISWAKERKASSWRFQSDTGQRIGPLMKRIGAVEESHYKLEL